MQLVCWDGLVAEPSLGHSGKLEAPLVMHAALSEPAYQKREESNMLKLEVSLGKCRRYAVKLCRQQTKHCCQVSPLFREPYILTGYREPYKSWCYYLTSCLQIHNETGNVWSHLVAFFLYFYYTIWYILHGASDVNGDVTAAGKRPMTGLIGFGMCCLLYSSLSSLAHLLHSRNEVVHYTCFLIDYIGIGLYGQGMSFMLYYCSGNKAFYDILGSIYLPVNCMLAVFACVCHGVAKLRYVRPYPPMRRILQIAGSGLQVAFLATPAYFRLYECMSGSSECISVAHHLRHINVFTLAIMFFALHVPERLWHGCFDIVGHGHQVFHVLITWATLWQFEGGHKDLTTLPVQTLAMAQGDLWLVIATIAISITLGLAFILVTRDKVRANAQRDSILPKDD